MPHPEESPTDRTEMGDIAEEKVTVSSDAEEDSKDEEMGSEDGSEEESDGEEEDDEEDEEEEDESDEDADDSGIVPGLNPMEVDSSDSESEKCPVCLSSFRDQDVGSPESCDHTFCLECILEWSKNVNTCPVDRQVFHLIMARHSLEGTVYKRIPVEDRRQGEDEEQDITYCEVCGQCDREDRMLLCDHCDLGYHLECLDPPLDRVPVEEWFCPDCSHREGPQRVSTSSQDRDEEVVYRLVEEVVVRRRPSRRQIARTQVSERVIARIMASRASRRIVSDEEFEEDDVDTSSITRRRTTSTTRRKTTRKRRTKKRRSTKSKTTGKRKRKVGRRKRKTKKGKKATPARTARTAIPTVKKRLAGRLGLGTPPAGRSIPTVKGRTERTMETQRSDIGVSSLSIFGSRHELDPYVEGSDDEIETRHSGGGCVISQPSRVRHGCFPTKAALKSYPAGVPSVSSTPLPGPGFDLLSDIMLGQQILRMNSEDITINRDGSLHLRKLPQETKSKCSQPKTSSRTVFTGLISDGRSPYRRAAGSEGNDSPAETSGGEQTNQRTSGDNSSDNSSSQTQDGNNAGAGDSGSPCEGAGDTSGHYGGDDIGGDSGYNMDNTTQAISDSVENESQNSQNAQNSDNRTDRTESSVSSPENKDEDECVENSKEDKSDNEQMVVDSTTGNDHNTAETRSYGGENNTCNNNDVENDAEVVTGSASVPGAADDVGDDSNDVMDTSQSYSPDAVTCSPKAAGNSTEAESCNPEAARGSPDAVGNSTGAVTCIPDHGRLSPSAEGHSQDFKPDSELREQSQESTDHPQEPAQSSDTLDKSKDSEKGIFPTINVPERESDGDAEENDEDPSCTDGQTNDLSQNNDHDNIDCNLNNDSQENANTLDYDKSSLSDVNELSVATDPEAAGNISDCELETQESAAANDNVDTTCNTGDENNAEAGGMSHYNPFEVIVISPKAMEGYGEDDETQGEIWGDEGMESGEIQEQVPISELPRIPKIKRKPSVEDENSQPGDGLRSVLSRIGTESKMHNYPKWEKREKREKEESRSEPERSQSEPDKNSKYTREDRESYSRDDRDGYGRDDREGYGREDRDSFGRDDREEDRDRRRDRHSKRRRRSRSREKDRRRSRSRDRDRKYRRSRERDRSSRDHSPGRDYDRHRRRRDRSRDRYFRRRSRSASPRRDRKYGYDRESSRHSTEDPPERIQKGNDEFKGTVRMFSQSLKEASDSDKDKRQRLKRSPRGDLDEAKPAKQFHMTLKMVPPDEVIELDNTDEEEEEEVNNAQPEQPEQPEEETKPEPPLPSVAPAPPKPEPVPLMEQDIPPPRSAQPGLSEDVYDPSQPTGSESPTPPELNTAEVRPLNMLQEIQFPRSQELLPPVTSGIQGVEGANVILPNLGGMVRMIPAGMRPHPMLMNPMMMGSHLRGLQRFPPGFPHPPMHMLRNRFPEVQNGVPLQPGRLPFPQGSLPPGMTPGLMEVPPPPGPPGPLQGQQLPPRPPPGPPPRLPADLQFNMEQPPPPLPQKADLNNISSLLNVQGKLAHLIRPPISEPPQSENMMVKQDEQLFKVPLPPPPLIQQPQAKMLPNKDTSNGPRVSAGPGSVNSSEVMEVVDMDVASPLEDDDMGISFSPPPEKDEPTTAGKGVSEGNSGKTGEDSSMKQDDIPASAVELDMQSKVLNDGYIKKLNRQERVVEEVKLAIKPHYNKGRINKEEYKEIMRKAVPRICHSKSGDINPVRIRKYVEACVEKARQQRKWEAKKEGSSASNSGKTSKKISGKV